MDHSYIERVVDLTDPAANRIYNLTVEQARTILLEKPAEAVRGIQGSFALLARSGKTVRMARSLDQISDRLDRLDPAPTSGAIRSGSAGDEPAEPD